MKPPFNLSVFKSRIASLRKPTDPVDHDLPYIVTLPSPTNLEEQVARWDEPQKWCRGNVDHGQGHQWSRRRKLDTGEIVFGFSDVPTGVHFALLFR
jgi:hypothetical protein